MTTCDQDSQPEWKVCGEGGCKTFPGPDYSDYDHVCASSSNPYYVNCTNWGNAGLPVEDGGISPCPEGYEPRATRNLPDRDSNDREFRGFNAETGVFRRTIMSSWKTKPMNILL